MLIDLVLYSHDKYDNRLVTEFEVRINNGRVIKTKDNLNLLFLFWYSTTWELNN